MYKKAAPFLFERLFVLRWKLCLVRFDRRLRLRDLGDDVLLLLELDAVRLDDALVLRLLERLESLA